MHSCSKNSELDLRLVGMLIHLAIQQQMQRFLATLALKLSSFQDWTRKKDKEDRTRKAWLSCGTLFPTTLERRSKFSVTSCMPIIAHQKGSNGTRTTTMMAQFRMTLRWQISTLTKGWRPWSTTSSRCSWLTRPSTMWWFHSATTSLSKTRVRASSTSKPSSSCATSTTLWTWNLSCRLLRLMWMHLKRKLSCGRSRKTTFTHTPWLETIIGQDTTPQDPLSRSKSKSDQPSCTHRAECSRAKLFTKRQPQTRWAPSSKQMGSC